MAIAVKCRACQSAFAVKDEIAGKRIRCVKCQEVLLVPGGASNVSPTAQSPKEQPPTSPIPAATPSHKQESPAAPTIRRARRITAEELMAPVVAVVANDDAEPTVRAQVVRGPQDLQAESQRHTVATLSEPPEDFETLRQKVFASFTSPVIQPVPVAVSYRIGIALTSFFMITLPLIYLAMIFGVGWLIYYHAINHTVMISAATRSASGRNSGRAGSLLFWYI